MMMIDELKCCTSATNTAIIIVLLRLAQGCRIPVSCHNTMSSMYILVYVYMYMYMYVTCVPVYMYIGCRMCVCVIRRSSHSGVTPRDALAHQL